MSMPVLGSEPEPITRDTDPAPTPAMAARLVYFSLLLLSLAALSAIFVPVWKPVILAGAIAASLIRYYEKLTLRLRGRKSIAAIIMTAGVLFFVLIPLGAILSFLVVQGTLAAKWVVDLLRESHGSVDNLIERLPMGFQDTARTVVEMVPIDAQQLAERAREASQWAATTVGSVLQATSSLVLSLGLTLIALYFFLVDGQSLVRWLARVLPLKDRQTYEVLDDFRQMARVVIGSNIAVGGLQATVASIAYVIAPVPHPAFFGLLTFMASFVPSVGTAIVSVPLTLLMLVMGKPWWALFIGVWGLVLVSAVDNVVRPLLLRGAGHIHGAVVFFSLIGGIGMFGPMGLIVGPLIITFVLAMVRLWQRDFNPQTHVPESVLDHRLPEKTPPPPVESSTT